MNIIIMFRLLFLIFIPYICFAQTVGSDSGLPLPRFISIKSNEMNLRKGPNVKFPTVWTYKRKGYPMEVIAEFENWRKLRDLDGTEGWTHENLISGNRSVIIYKNFYFNKPKALFRDNELILFRYQDENSYPMIRAELGVIARLKKCQGEWCKVKIGEITAWALKQNLWGVYPDEIVN